MQRDDLHRAALLAAKALHVRPEGLGLLSASFGVGALTGALVAASFRVASRRVFCVGATAFGGLMLALAPVTNPVLATLVLFGVGVAFTLVAANALVQLGAPARCAAA